MSIVFERSACIVVINILTLVEDVMVDYHKRGKIAHSGKRISPETKSRGMSNAYYQMKLVDFCMKYDHILYIDSLFIIYRNRQYILQFFRFLISE